MAEVLLVQRSLDAVKIYVQVAAMPLPFYGFCVRIKLIPQDIAIMTVRNHFIIAAAFHRIQGKGCCKRNANQKAHMPAVHGIHVILTVKALIHDHMQPFRIDQIKSNEAFFHCADIVDASRYGSEEQGKMACVPTDHQKVDLRKLVPVSVISVGYEFIQLAVGGYARDVHTVVSVVLEVQRVYLGRSPHPPVLKFLLLDGLQLAQTDYEQICRIQIHPEYILVQNLLSSVFGIWAWTLMKS